MHTAPKLVFFDVENSPSLGYYYDLYKEGNIVSTVQPWFMLSFAWKRPGTDRVYCRGLIDYPGYEKDKTNDEKLVKDLWKLFDENDILVGQNINRFDIRKANSRFLYWNLPPPSPYRTVDTLQISRRVSKQDSNSLGSLSKFFGYGDKLPTTGWDTWQGAIDGKRSAWDVLKKYNQHDVRITEKVWSRLAPYLPNHPALTALGSPGCPVCQSLNVQSRGWNHAKTQQTPRLQCTNCGHWFTGTPIRRPRQCSSPSATSKSADTSRVTARRKATTASRVRPSMSRLRPASAKTSTRKR